KVIWICVRWDGQRSSSSRSTLLKSSVSLCILPASILQAPLWMDRGPSTLSTAPLPSASDLTRPSQRSHSIRTARSRSSTSNSVNCLPPSMHPPTPSPSMDCISARMDTTLLLRATT
ncbi:hypothetical protein EV175_007449, partial [Coemansia sp. RSA 1933]